jgi:hypothetical protein
MKTIVKGKEYHGRDFLKCTQGLKELGFADNEIENAIEQAGAALPELIEALQEVKSWVSVNKNCYGGREVLKKIEFVLTKAGVEVGR